MIEKQREKEFLFELEWLYHNYSLIIDVVNGYKNALGLVDVGQGDIDETTAYIECAVDGLRDETLEDVR